MALILLAAISKLVYRADFEADLVAWDIESQRIREVLSLAIPLTELMIALAWVLRFSTTAAIFAAALMLLAFSAAYARLWIQGRAPSCGCFGGLLRFQNAKSEAPFVLARNTLLIAGLLLPPLISRLRSRRSDGKHSASRPTAPQGVAPNHGFTLIETLLAIVLVAILAAISVPSLSKFRVIADRSQSVQTSASLAKVFAAYSSDFRDFMPYFTDPKATYSVVYHDDLGMKLEYFGAYYTWHVALGDRYFNAPPTSPIYYARKDRPQLGFGPTSFWYSASFLADPAFWKMETRTGPEQWRATRLAEVIFPSSKAVLFDSYHWFYDQKSLNRKTSILAFVDASAETLDPSRVITGYPHGTGQWHGNAMLTYPAPGMVTIEGVRGRDR